MSNSTPSTIAVWLALSVHENETDLDALAIVRARVAHRVSKRRVQCKCAPSASSVGLATCKPSVRVPLFDEAAHASIDPHGVRPLRERARPRAHDPEDREG